MGLREANRAGREAVNSEVLGHRAGAAGGMRGAPKGLGWSLGDGEDSIKHD